MRKMRVRKCTPVHTYVYAGFILLAITDLVRITIGDINTTSSDVLETIETINANTVNSNNDSIELIHVNYNGIGLNLPQDMLEQYPDESNRTMDKYPVVPKPRPHSKILRRQRVSPEQQLLADLLENYHTQGRPILNASESITVTVELYLQQIAKLDEKQQVFIARGWLYTVWQDQLLTWNPDDYGGITYVNMLPKYIWTPELAIGNSVREVFDKSYNDIRVVLMANGTVNWFPGGVFHTACTIRIFYYPFDSQKCTIAIQQWNSVDKTMFITNSSSVVYLNEYMENGQWSIEATTAWRHSDLYPLGQVGQIYFDFYLIRKSKFYLINIIFPCLMISSLSMMVFYLPPDSGEKVTLGTTVLLAFTVFLLLIAEIVPRTSDQVPLLTTYLTTCMFLTTISVLLSIVVLRIHHHDTSTPTGIMFKLVYKIVYKLIAPIVMRKIKRAEIEVESPSEEGDELLVNSVNNAGAIDNLEADRKKSKESLAHKYNKHIGRSVRIGSKYKVIPRSKTVECIENNKLKFRFVAMVCDRLLLILFFITNFAATIAFLVLVPLSRPDQHIHYVASHNDARTQDTHYADYDHE